MELARMSDHNKGAILRSVQCINAADVKRVENNLRIFEEKIANILDDLANECAANNIGMHTIIILGSEGDKIHLRVRGTAIGTKGEIQHLDNVHGVSLGNVQILSSTGPTSSVKDPMVH